MGHGEASGHLWEAVAEPGARLRPLRSVPTVAAGRQLPGASSPTPASAAALPCAASARWHGGRQCRAWCTQGRDAGEVISVSVPDKQMEPALSYYLRAKREKLSGVFRLAGQWALWASAAAGCFSGVAATPTPALDSVRTGQHRVPGNRVRYTLRDMGSARQPWTLCAAAWSFGSGARAAAKLGCWGDAGTEREDGDGTCLVAMVRGQ